MIAKYKRIIIYLVIILLSIIPSIVMFNIGFVDGHDNEFHFAQIQDLYLSWEQGDILNYINKTTNHYFGMGVKLMYAPLSHLATVLIAFIIIPFGFTLTSAMKVTIYLSVVLSGIFTYHLAKKATKNEFTSLIAATFYMLFPYRFTDIYIRNAFAETIAMAFIPLVFNGVYSIIKMDKFQTKPFILTIIGVVLVFMTHNITAIYTFIFVAIFALFFYKDILKLIKKPFFWCGCIFSIMLIIFLVSPLLFPLLQHYNLGIYRIFNQEAMNTSLEKILNEIDRTYAFLNAGASNIFINNFIYLIIGTILIYSTYIAIKKYMNDKNKNTLIFMIIAITSLTIALIVSFIIQVQYIIYLALIFECILYFIPVSKNIKKTNFNIILATLTLLIISLLLSTTTFLWNILPSFLYTIQFPWRLWVFVAFFGGFLLAVICTNLSSLSKHLKPILAFLAVAMIVVIRPIYIDSYQTSEENTIDITDTYSIYSAGWQLEYFPIELFEGSKSTYWWNCYLTMRADNDDKIERIGVYKGNASSSNYTLYEDGSITFTLNTIEKSIIQVPKIYYLGYKVTLIDEAGHTHILNTFDTECFLSFETDLSGEVKVEYVGTKLMNSSKYLFSIGVLLLVSIPIIIDYKRRKDYQVK